ncbi:MAG: alpha/beta hydrolase, partial [Pseudomonadota bacterium]
AGHFHKLSAPLSIEQNAEFLLSQIDQSSKIPKVIVSVSLGSMIAIEMVQRESKLFEKVFVMNTSFSNLSPIHHRLQLNALKQFYMIAKSKGLLDREKEILAMVSRAREKHLEIAKDWARIAEQRPMKVSNVLRQLAAAARYKLVEERPQTPIVIFNSKGDEMVDSSCSEKLADFWNLPLETHPTAGHDICIDDPDWVIEKIAQNLN